jgi:hypothetical protein
LPKSWSKQPVPHESGKFTIRLEWEDKQTPFMDLVEHLKFDGGSKLDKDLDAWAREPNKPPHGHK